MSEREEIERTIAQLEGQRSLLGDAVVGVALAALREKLATLLAQEAQQAPQRKLVTVLFADLSGFTAMSETMDAEDVRDRMNLLWSHLDGAIIARGGIIDKHIGDAVMALFGTPTAREDDAERAVQAALAMQAALETVSEAVGGAEGRELLRMRIGLNTGMVLLGSVGSRGEYTAMGDAVNLASRLEHAAPPGGILISQDTYRHVQGRFEVEPLPPLQVKGKREPVQVYLVRGERQRRFRMVTRGVEGIETRMVGRDGELAQLQAAFQATATGRAQVVTVVGEAGVGKSRLLREFRQWALAEAPETVSLRARCDEQRQGSPYALVHDLLAEAFDILHSDAPAMVREKLMAGITAILDTAGAEAAPLIGHLGGFDFGDSPVLRGIRHDARQLRDRAFHALGQFLAGLCHPPGGAERRLLCFLDDLHWADDGSLDLLAFLRMVAADQPIMFLCLTRPTLFERRPEWGAGAAGEAAVTRVPLMPLSPIESGALVDEILRYVPEVPAPLRALIVQEAEGNPFYVEEFIKMLIEERVIVKGDGAWQVTQARLADLRVPPTLTALLQARLDSLPVGERETLLRAAVVGQVFWDHAVAALVGPEREERRVDALRLPLDHLAQRELVFSRARSAFAASQEYTFKHAALQEVAYEAVLKRLRLRYHRQVADWLIEASGERASEYAGLIATHFERAEAWGEAATWYGRAGQLAQATYAPAVAIEHYNRALRFLPGEAGPASRIVWTEGLATMLLWQARYAEAGERFVTLAALAAARGDAAAEARAWQGRSLIAGTQGNQEEALAHARQAATVAEAGGIPLEVANALYSQGVALLRAGDVQGALRAGQEALALSSDLRAEREMARSLNLLGWIHQMLGQEAEAERLMREALALFRGSGDRQMTSMTLNNLGAAAHLRGALNDAAHFYEEALVIDQMIGNRDGELISLSNLGGARAALGHYAAAEADLRAVIRLTEQAGKPVHPETYRFLAEALLGQGQHAEAQAMAQQSLALAQAHDDAAVSEAAMRLLERIEAGNTERP